MKLHHIGISVPNLEQAAAFYQQLGFAPETGTPVELKSRGVRVFFLSNPQGTRLELVEKPAPEASPYHLAYLVEEPLHPGLAAQTADRWELVPELGISNIFLPGPGGERVELVREAQ